MKIDDMKVSDFLYLLDCMQEECCESTCPNCRYFDFCEIDLSSIDSASIERTVEGYAEANGLIDRMHYVNQKWIPCNERLPNNMDDVLCCYEYKVTAGRYKGELSKYYGVCFYSKYHKKWFGEEKLDSNRKVVAWMPLPKAYEGETDNVD